eukprot:4473907-Amphidinium_carterae.1
MTLLIGTVCHVHMELRQVAHCNLAIDVLVDAAELKPGRQVVFASSACHFPRRAHDAYRRYNTVETQ